MEIKEVINKTKKVEDGNFYNQNLSSALIEDGAEVLQQGNIVEDGNFYNQNLSSALIEQDDDILGDLHVDETDIYDTTLSSVLIEDEILQSLNGDLTVDEDCNVFNLSLSSSLIDDEVANCIDGDLTVDEVSNIINLSISSSLIDDEVSNCIDGDLTVDEESFYDNVYERTINEENGIIVPDTYKFVLSGSTLPEYAPQLLNGVFSDLQYSDLTTVNNSLSEDIVFTDGTNNYNCTVSVSSRADNESDGTNETNGTDDYAPHNLFASADKRTSDIPGVCGTGNDLIYTGQFTTPLPFDLLSNLSLDFGVVPKIQSASAPSKQLYEIRIYCKKVDNNVYVGFSGIQFANGTLVSTEAGSTPLRSGDAIINFNGDDVNVHLTVSNRDNNCTEPLVNALNGGELYLQGYKSSSYGVEFDYVMTFEDPVYLTDLNFYMTTYMPSDTRGFARSIRFEIYSYTIENNTKNYTLIDTINYYSEDRYKTIAIATSLGTVPPSLTNKLYYEVFDSNNSSVLLKSYYNGNFSTNENVSFDAPTGTTGLYTIELNIPSGVGRYSVPIVSDAVFANLTYDRCNSARNATATSEEIVFIDEGNIEYTCTISVTSRWRDNGSDDYAPHNLFAPSNKRVSSMGAILATNSPQTITIAFTTPIAMSKLAGLSIYAGWHTETYTDYSPTIEYTLYKDGVALYNETVVNATSRGDYQMTFTPFNQSN